MANTKRKFDLGVKLSPTDTSSTTAGEMRVSVTSPKLKVHLDGSERNMVSEDQSQTLTNKTIDADSNIITNIDNNDIKAAAGIEESKLALDYSTSSLNTAINNHLSDTTDAHDASAISNSPTGNLAATDVQAALNELQGDIDTLNTDMTAVEGDVADLVTLSGVAVNSTDLGTFTGTTIPDNSDIKEALQALETEVETKIDSTDLNNHMSDTTTHGTTGDIVGTSDVQTLTNKTIVAANNTITTAASGNLAATELNAALSELQTDIDTRATSSALSTHTGATSGVHGVTGSVVGTSDTQTLTNKDIDGGTASNSNRITLPKASKATLDGLTRKEATLVYASDLDKVYYDDGTNLRAVGSGSGSDINYIENGDAEIGTTGWATYADAAGTIPVDGTGGSPVSTFSSASGANLRGTRYFNLTKGSANRQGEGFSYDFTVDLADLTKQLVISFDYIASGNYVDGDMKLFVYDIANSTLIRVNGEDILASDKGTHYARFQTSSNSQLYRLIFHVSSTSALSYNFQLDNVKVGPKAIVYGSPITDMKADTGFTSSLTGTISAKSRRVGDSKEVELSFAYSSGTGTFEITPTVDALDELKISLEGDRNNLGTAYIFDTDTAANRRLGTVYWNDTTKSIRIILDAGSDVSNTSPFTMVAGDDIQMRFTYPVAGWSANAAMSEDFSGRDVYAKLGMSASQSIPDSTAQKILNFTASSDTTNSWNITNDDFIVPESGYYDIGLSLFFTSNVTGTRAAYIYINGVEQSRGQITAGSNVIVKTDTILRLEKGDLVSFYALQSSGGALNLEASVRTFAYIAKRSSSQQLFETETVAAIYANCAQNIPSSTNTTLTFDDKIVDTHNAYNTSTGIFTAPYSGYYHISASSGITSGSVDTGRAYMYIIASTNTIFGNRILMTTANMLMVVTGTVYLSKGQTALVGVNHTEGVTRAINDTFCDLSIIRVK